MKSLSIVRLWKTGVFVFLLQLIFFSASATNYYVDPSSPGANLGTVTDPWKSMADIPATINYFLPGDTVFFKRGQWYTGTLSINSTGANGAPIVFMPYGSGNAPVLQYNLASPDEPRPADRMIIRLNQVNHIVIDGFELTDTSIPEFDRTISANVGHGVFIYKGPGNNGSYNVVKNLTISRLGAGVTISEGSYNTITACTMRNMRMAINTSQTSFDDHGAVGIILGGSNNTITHNTIQDCWANSFDYQYDGGAIEMYGAVSDNKIMYNTATDNLGFMEFGSNTGAVAANNQVAYNLLINNGHVLWINSNNGFGVNVLNLQLLNNNVIETKPPLIADITSLIGISNTPLVSNVLTLKNNLFWIATAINITDPVARPFNGPQLIHQNNLYYTSGGSLGFNIDASEQQSNTSTPPFSNIYSYSNPIQWDLNLQPNSIAVDRGQHTGINTDFYGNEVPYGNAPDIGMAENVNALLPVEFLSSRGWATTAGNYIEWVTNSDVADHFEVEKSTDGIHFTAIAVIPYKTNAGSATVTYQYIDNNIPHPLQHYRIKVVEPGNHSSYSKIISIQNSRLPTGLTVLPNPAQEYIMLTWPGNSFLNKEVVVVNMAGVEVKRVKVNDAGSQVRINISMLPKGFYAVKIVDLRSGTHFTTTFTK